MWFWQNPVKRVWRTAYHPPFDEAPPELEYLILRFGAEPFLEIRKRLSAFQAQFVLGNGFPLFRDQINNLEDLKAYGRALAQIAEASGGREGEVFIDGLPAVKDLIASYGIEPFVEIAQATGHHVGVVFRYFFPLVRDQISGLKDLKAYSQAITEIARASGHNSYFVFCLGLPEVKDLIAIYGIQPFIEIVQASCGNALYVLRYGLPFFRDQIRSLEDLKAFGQALAEIVKGSYCEEKHSFSGAEYALRDGLPFFRDQIRSLEDLKVYGQALAEFAQVDCGEHFFRFGLPTVKDLIANNGIRPLIEIAQASQSGAYVVFKEGLPGVKDLIAKYGIEPFIAIAQASGLRAGTVFRDGIPLVRDQIGSLEDLKAYGLALAEIEQNCRLRQTFKCALPRIRGRFLELFNNKDRLIADLRDMRSKLIHPYEVDDPQGAYVNDPDNWEELGDLLSALKKADFSRILTSGAGQLNAPKQSVPEPSDRAQ